MLKQSMLVSMEGREVMHMLVSMVGREVMHMARSIVGFIWHHGDGASTPATSCLQVKRQDVFVF
jgi:hypothetical protein